MHMKHPRDLLRAAQIKRDIAARARCLACCVSGADERTSIENFAAELDGFAAALEAEASSLQPHAQDTITQLRQ
jgi:hypothetical protein